MTPLEFIQTRAPSLATATNVNELILQAEAETSDGYYTTDLHNKAVGLLVCHWLALENRNATGSGGAGMIIREKEGHLERAYQAANYTNQNVEIDPDLSQTRWGLELLQLQRKSFLSIRNRMI